MKQLGKTLLYSTLFAMLAATTTSFAGSKQDRKFWGWSHKNNCNGVTWSPTDYDKNNRRSNGQKVHHHAEDKKEFSYPGSNPGNPNHNPRMRSFHSQRGLVKSSSLDEEVSKTKIQVNNQITEINIYNIHCHQDSKNGISKAVSKNHDAFKSQVRPVAKPGGKIRAKDGTGDPNYYSPLSIKDISLTFHRGGESANGGNFTRDYHAPEKDLDCPLPIYAGHEVTFNFDLRVLSAYSDVIKKNGTFQFAPDECAKDIPQDVSFYANAYFLSDPHEVVTDAQGRTTGKILDGENIENLLSEGKRTTAFGKEASIISQSMTVKIPENYETGIYTLRIAITKDHEPFNAYGTVPVKDHNTGRSWYVEDQHNVSIIEIPILVLGKDYFLGQKLILEK